MNTAHASDRSAVLRWIARDRRRDGGRDAPSRGARRDRRRGACAGPRRARGTGGRRWRRTWRRSSECGAPDERATWRISNRIREEKVAWVAEVISPSTRDRNSNLARADRSTPSLNKIYAASLSPVSRPSVSRRSPLRAAAPAVLSGSRARPSRTRPPRRARFPLARFGTTPPRPSSFPTSSSRSNTSPRPTSSRTRRC